jgi:ketosteroid isomerase-like protein
VTADPEGVVRAHVAAFSAGRLPELLDGLADDVTWRTGTTSARGRAEVAALLSDAVRDLAPTLAIRTLVAAGDLVACELTETLVVAGERRVHPVAAFYRARDGRVAAVTVYREGSAEVAQTGA